MTIPEPEGRNAIGRSGTTALHGEQRLKTKPLSDALGLKVLDVDLHESQSPSRVTQLREAWYEGLILLLRDQRLTEEDQVRFAEYFGPLGRTINVHNTGRHPAIMLISNIRKDGKPIGALPDGEMQFHTDQWKHRCGARLYSGLPRVPGHAHHAGVHEHRKEEAPERVRS